MSDFPLASFVSFFGAESKSRPIITESAKLWISKYEPQTLGDAMCSCILKDLSKLSFSTDQEYITNCYSSEEIVLSVRNDDKNWGSVTKKPDVYSNCQASAYEWIYGSKTRATLLFNYAQNLITDYPWNIENSNTTFNYRKASEILLQIHCLVAVGKLIDCPFNEKSQKAILKSFVEFGKNTNYLQFMSPIFRLNKIQQITNFNLNDFSIDIDSLTIATLNRLLVSDGFLEYRIEDKIDERAKSKSRSLKDVSFPWAFSTAYGLILLKKYFPTLSEVDHKQLLSHSKNRLENWPNLESQIHLKEFGYGLGQSASSYSLLMLTCSYFTWLD